MFFVLRATWAHQANAGNISTQIKHKNGWRPNLVTTRFVFLANQICQSWQEDRAWQTSGVGPFSVLTDRNRASGDENVVDLSNRQLPFELKARKTNTSATFTGNCHFVLYYFWRFTLSKRCYASNFTLLFKTTWIYLHCSFCLNALLMHLPRNT